MITDSGNSPVETQYKVDTRKEVMFYYQNRQEPHTRQRQLKINTSESNFQLLNYESYFKSNDRLKRAEINQSMEFFASPVEWFTRGEGYNFNRYNGDINTNVITSTITGVDGIAGSAVEVTDFDLTNASERQSLVVWALNTPPVFDPSIVPIAYGDPIDNWQLYYYNGTIAINTLISGSIFDLRVFEEPIQEQLITEYRDKFKYYLPRA